MLERPNFVIFDDLGNILELYCKVCGKEIAWRMGKRLAYGELYAQLKFRMSDGSYHISCCCRDCVHKTEDYQAMYEADVPVSTPYETGRMRTVERLVKVVYGEVGLP